MKHDAGNPFTFNMARSGSHLITHTTHTPPQPTPHVGLLPDGMAIVAARFN